MRIKLQDVNGVYVPDKRNWITFAHQLSIKEPNLEYINDNIEGYESFHQNYLFYLDKCYSEHHGIVFTPDILWYTILCELVQIVASDVEGYRHLFSKSKEKQTIIIDTADTTFMPLDRLIDALRFHVPTNIDIFLPTFTTTSERSQMAMFASFADMCSPYYEYCTTCCGFPHIDVLGTPEDYQKISDYISLIGEVLFTPYLAKAKKTVDRIIENLDSPEFWNKMFFYVFCGSGSEDYDGWWKDIYFKEPRTNLLENWASHISKVNYKDLTTNINYTMKTGLFVSNFVDDVLMPDFGYVIYQNKE